MNLYTIQMSQWRKAKALNVPFLDTSVKSGERCFAPTWDLLMGYKNGEISETEYTLQYKDLMRKSLRTHSDRWKAVATMDTVALACYCKAGVFCHRHLMADIIKQLCLYNNIDFTHMGEIV